MKGLDKIIGRIRADAAAEIDAIRAEGDAKAAEVTAAYEAQAKALLDSEAEKSRQAAQSMAERGQRTDAMDKSKAILAAKQQCIDEAFDRAAQKLRQLPREEYISVLAALAASAGAGDEEIILSAADAAAIGAKATLVESMDEADVVVYHATSFDENYDYMVEDADLAGKPIVLIVEGTTSTEPGLTQIMDCNAVMMQTYSNTPDHGSSVGSYYRYVTPSVTADMIFGAKSPAGSTLFEIEYNEGDLDLSWGELQHDIGVDTTTRLWMAGMVRENPNMVLYNNLGNVLCTTNYGMTYGEEADIVLDTFVVPQVLQVSEVESSGSISLQTSIVNASPKAGEAFEINFLATNKGADGHVTAQVLDNGKLIAEKFIALDAGQFRVITIEIALDAGEHVISVGDMSATIVVE